VTIGILLAAAFSVGAGAEPGRVNDALSQFDKKISAMMAEFDKKYSPAKPQDPNWVRADLQHMVDLDKAVNEGTGVPYAEHYKDEEHRVYDDQFSKRFDAIRAANEMELKDLLKANGGWITISKFGAKADEQATLLVRHSDQDPEFQKVVLNTLAPLAAKHETNPRNYAALYDQVAITEGQPQSFGTHGHCKDGKWKPDEIAEPDGVNARRKAIGLDPLEHYVEESRSKCG
jgi:hypothetical protein